MAPPVAVVAGSMAQRPFVGGHTWALLQYLLGFREMGWDVHFVDRLEPEMCVDEHGRQVPLDHSVNLRYLEQVMDGFGLAGRWTLGCEGWRKTRGADRATTMELLRRSTVLIDVMGFLGDDELLDAAPMPVFLDIDPGFPQMWFDLGLHDPFGRHARYVTIGENVGRPGCSVPTCGIDWITTKQPVALEHWPVSTARADTYTSVASWRGPFAPIERNGVVYGLRAHQFRRFAALPLHTSARLAVALDIDSTDAADAQRLTEQGWTLLDPASVACDPWRYRDFIAGSRGETMIAKGMYVQTRSGWFSDRSACYLASGRPVLAQDTGLGRRLPTGLGVVTFDELGEATDGLAAIERDYVRHARAARTIAEQHFAAPCVLGRLVERLGVT